MGLRYTDSHEGIAGDQLRGFFVGWPDPPSPETLLRLLQGSYAIELAIDDASGRVVGFVYAVSDGVLSVYVPLLEVLPEYQGRGIGSNLMRRLLSRLSDFYMIDLLCDPDRQSYYERFGMRPFEAMGLRRYEHQAGRRP